jgi:hypothetical protein
MAVENVKVINREGSSAYVAGDLVGTNFYQYMKLDLGADGASAPVSGALPVSASSLPLPSGAATSAYQNSELTKLDTIISLLGTSSASQVWKSYNTTTTATGAAIWTPGSGKKIAITHLTIGTYGTTAGRVILWFGGSADTTYSEGTDQPVFKGSFAPSASGTPGAILQPDTPIIAQTADHLLRITTDAAMSVDVVVYGYEI